MKKFLIALMFISALAVTVPMASDENQVEELATGDASFRIRTTGPTLP